MEDDVATKRPEGSLTILPRSKTGRDEPECDRAPDGAQQHHPKAAPLPAALRGGDVDLSVHGGGGPRDRIRERLAGFESRPALSIQAEIDSESAAAHDLHGWAAYLSMVALTSGSPSTLGIEGYAATLRRFCENYPKANGMMFPIETGNLLEWLVDELPQADDPSIIGPAAFYRSFDPYWTSVERVAELYLIDCACGPNRYDAAALHMRIAEGVLGNGE